MAELKPCPFCGCCDRRVNIRKQGAHAYRVVCGRCGASGPRKVVQDWHDSKFVAQGQAANAWNRRAEGVV